MGHRRRRREDAMGGQRGKIRKTTEKSENQRARIHIFNIDV